MSTENSPQVWRVVVACDEVQPHTHTREVDVYRNHLGWFTSETTSLGLATSHAAVMEHVHEKRWPVVEIVAPGQPTRAELEARNADLAKDRDTALASSLALLHARDELRAILDAVLTTGLAECDRLRAELAKVTSDARLTFLCNEIAAVACTRAVDHNERAIRAAEALAAEVARLTDRVCDLTLDLHGEREKVAELRTILEGSTVAPTDREIDAHHAAGGSWLTGDTVTWAPASLRGMRDGGEAEGCVWIALDRDYRPCARPVVEVSE